MRYFILFLCCFLLRLSAIAQNDTAFAFTYGGIQDDVCSQIKPTYDNGYITIGTTSSCGHGNTDVYVIKTDAYCHKQWSEVIGGPVNEEGFSVAPTFDKGYVFAGFTDSWGNGGYDVYLVKTDSSGAVLWQKTYGGPDWDFGYSVAQTPDSGFVICGLTYSYGSGNGNIYAVKTNKNGDTLWTRAIGSSGFSRANSVFIHSVNVYTIVGEEVDTVTGDSSIYIVQLSNKGALLNSIKLGGPTHNFTAASVEGTDDGGYLVYGNTDSLKTPGVDDEILYRLDSNLVVKWCSVFGSPKQGWAKDAQLTPGDTIVTVGSYNSYGAGGFAVHMQAINYGAGWWYDGDAFGGTADDYGNSLAIAKNGNIVFAGATDSYGQGLFDFYLIRVKSDSIISHYTVVNQAYADTPCSVSSVPYLEVPQVGVKIYPNPMVSEATFLIQGTIKGTPHLNIYNIEGKLVIQNIETKSIGFGQYMTKVENTGLAKGTYVYQLTGGDGVVASGKLLVQ